MNASKMMGSLLLGGVVIVATATFFPPEPARAGG